MNLVLVACFLLAPPALFVFTRAIAGRIISHRYSPAEKSRGKGRLAVRLGLTVEVGAGTGGEEPGKSTARYALHAALLSLRNVFAAFAVVAMTIGIAGLWARPGWTFRVAPMERFTAPFEAEAGNIYLMSVEGPGDPGAVISLSAGDGAVRLPVRSIGGWSGRGDSSRATVVFRMKERGQPRIMISAAVRGSYRVALVRRPVRVIGFLLAELFLSAVAMAFGLWRRFAPLPGSEPGAIAVIAGRGVLTAAFTFSFLASASALWYLGIKALDRAFHFGIWITYDHFIQDIMRRLFN